MEIAEPIEIPEWTASELNSIISVRLYINGIQKDSNVFPIYYWKDYDGRKKNFVRSIRLELHKFYFKFIVDRLECLSEINKKYPNLNYLKFISQHTAIYYPARIPSGVDDFYIEVDFRKVREQIITYLEQKIGLIKEVKELKDLFSNNNTLTFEDFLDKKSKFLSKLNLKNYITELNKQTEIKKVILWQK